MRTRTVTLAAVSLLFAVPALAQTAGSGTANDMNAPPADKGAAAQDQYNQGQYQQGQYDQAAPGAMGNNSSSSAMAANRPYGNNATAQSSPPPAGPAYDQDQPRRQYGYSTGQGNQGDIDSPDTQGGNPSGTEH